MSVGAYLRDLRERQGISLEELSRTTRVLSRYLEALEADNLASLPAPVFTRGFIRAYCQALGVPSDEAIALYDQGAGQGRERPRNLAPPPPDPDDHARAPGGEPGEGRGRGAVLVSFVLLVILGAALFAVTLALQSGREGDGGQPVPMTTPQVFTPAPEPAVSAAVPAESPVAPTESVVTPPPALPPSPSAPSVNTPSAAAPGPAPPQLPGGVVSPYRLVARTTEATWMRVRTEDGRTVEETIPANAVREWVSNGPFVLSIGNAGGVNLELNGRPIPRLGASGAVITRLVLPPDTP